MIIQESISLRDSRSPLASNSTQGVLLMLKPLIVIAVIVLMFIGCDMQSYAFAATKPLAAMSLEDMFPGDESTQALAKAASDGDIETVDDLVSKGADVNAVGVRNYTPLVWLIEHPNKKGFRRLLELGANPNLRREGSDFSPLHLAVSWSSPMSRGLDLDYLRMMFEVGGADPNLPGLKTGELPIEEALSVGEEHVFMCLLSAGANVNRTGSCDISIITHAARVSNYQIVLYLLENGVDWRHVSSAMSRPVSLHSTIDGQIEWEQLFVRDPKMPQYMWFWRVVDFLEQKGVKFDIPADVQRPETLDTTPVVLNTEAPSKVRLSRTLLVHEVKLTYPAPLWAQSEETADDVRMRSQKSGGIITYDFIPKDDSSDHWTQKMRLSATYAPGESFEGFWQGVRAMYECPEKDGLTAIEEEKDRKLYHFYCAKRVLDGVLFFGRHKNTFIMVVQAWRTDAVDNVKSLRERAIADMQKIRMEDGLAVRPMTEEMEQQLKQ